MSESTPDAPTAPPGRNVGGGNLVAALAWFAIAAAFVKFFGVDGLREQVEHATWVSHDATVLASEVHASRDDPSRYVLHVEIEVTFDDELSRTYEALRYSGPSGSMNARATGEFAVGARVPVLVDPDDRSRFAFPKSHPYGPYLVGFLPGIVFGLMGVSVLLNRRADDPADLPDARPTRE